MKKIEAIIRKSKFNDVKEALHSVEVNFFSYWDVTGVGSATTNAVVISSILILSSNYFLTELFF